MRILFLQVTTNVIQTTEGRKDLGNTKRKCTRDSSLRSE